MRRPAAHGRNETTVLGEITSTLKQTARQAGICIVLLSQLSRAVESRDDKRPMLSDLRESGSIEQDADVVLFPFRPFYYLSKTPPKGPTTGPAYLDWEIACQDVRRRMEVICAKQRGGAEGVDVQRYFAEFDHIEDDREG
jgi:replicative DNA helicase